MGTLAAKNKVKLFMGAELVGVLDFSGPRGPVDLRPTAFGRTKAS